MTYIQQQEEKLLHQKYIITKALIITNSLHQSKFFKLSKLSDDLYYELIEKLIIDLNNIVCAQDMKD